MSAPPLDHYTALHKLCRLCGEKRSKGRPYHISNFIDILKTLFDMEVNCDNEDRYPRYICYTCQSQLSVLKFEMHSSDTAIKSTADKSALKMVEWEPHSDNCSVCSNEKKLKKAAKSPPKGAKDKDKAVTKEVAKIDIAKPTPVDTFVKPAPKRKRADSLKQKDTKVVLKISDLNDHLVCPICHGYVINATTITECLHTCKSTFCKSCIVKHLQIRNNCPVCLSIIPNSAPLSYLRLDTKLQDIIYKLVPGLYDGEMKRKRDFYASRGLPCPDDGAPVPTAPLPAAADAAKSDAPAQKFPPNDGRAWFHQDDIKLSLCLEPEGKNSAKLLPLPMKYIRCSYQLKVAHLIKFIQNKTSPLELELICNSEKLGNDVTLENIWLNTWKVKEAPMRLYYKKKGT